VAIRLLAICGSTRTGSLNGKLLDLAVGDALEAGAEVTRISLRDYVLPLYDGDLEISDFPETARALKALFVAHDGLLIASPEYNGSVSGVLKNALDWASRPTDGEGLTALSAFRGKAAGLMSASISPFGGLRGVTHLRQILGTVQAIVATEQVLVPFATNAFDGPNLIEPLPRALLGGLVKRTIELAGFQRYLRAQA